jgi:hypothetical protein
MTQEEVRALYAGFTGMTSSYGGMAHAVQQALAACDLPDNTAFVLRLLFLQRMAIQTVEEAQGSQDSTKVGHYLERLYIYAKVFTEAFEE